MALNAAKGQLEWTTPAFTSKAASLIVPLKMLSYTGHKLYEVFH